MICFLDANCFFSVPTSEATVSDSATAMSVLLLKHFKFLAVKIESTTTGSQANCDCETPQTQLNKFLTEMHVAGQHPGALHYWHERRATYDCLADTDLHLLAEPASQAYTSNVCFLFVAY